MKSVTPIHYISGFLLIVSFLFFSCKNDGKSTVDSNVEPEQEIANYLEESEADFDKRMQWWRQDKFGLFIHWGVYSVPAGIYNGNEVKGLGEWIMNDGRIPIKEYEKFSKQFNPSAFDAKGWVKVMKEAGIKYIVITSKHHDGFGLWDSKVSDYDIVDYAPYGKDLLKQLSGACHEEGIKFGLYYSIMDWHHPQAQAIHEPNYNAHRGGKADKTNPEFQTYLEDYMKPQLKELVEAYDPAIMWFDGEWLPDYTHENGLDIYQYVRSLKPSILINNRVDIGRRGLMGMNDGKHEYVGDFGTPEKEILDGTSSMDWESCMTMNDTWGFKANDDNWKSTELLVHQLIDVAAKGGNYLLNIGPKSDGTIPQASVDRLRGIGKWLNTNSEAIYNTEKLSFNYKQGEDIRYIKKEGEDTIYAVSLVQPNESILLKHVKPIEDSSIELLGASKHPLNWTYKEGSGLTISLPAAAIKEVGETEAWVFKINGTEVK